MPNNDKLTPSTGHIDNESTAENNHSSPNKVDSHEDISEGVNFREKKLHLSMKKKAKLDVNADLSINVSDTRSSRAKHWSRIESITIRNFKAVQDTTVDLGDVTVLVGANGSGKSSILQAIHWAARAASYIKPKNGKEMISFERLDFVPSSEPLKTAHKDELKSKKVGKATEVIFTHVDDAGGPSSKVTIQIKAANNKGGITAYIEGNTAVTPYKQRFVFITAYIPGLAGLSERETILAQPLLRRQAASGDAGSVLRNVLFHLKSKGPDEKDNTKGTKRLKDLNDIVSEIHPGISLDINFDAREDYHISASYTDPGLYPQQRTLETAATGLLQTIQIFAYLIYFEPKIMLIDEPDAHLHPDKQERLIEALERAAQKLQTQIILTTHSPHIVRAASEDAKLIWIKDGAVQTDDGDAIRRLLGWGGLDKRALFFVEDEDDRAIRAILRQWPALYRQISVCRCFGIANLPKDKFLKGLLVDGQFKMRGIVHRDRDFMTEKEAAKWSAKYKTEGVFPWVTLNSDIEGYFCTVDYLSNLFGVKPGEAEKWRAEAAATIPSALKEFRNKRTEVNRMFVDDGGSPDTDDLWKQMGEQSPATVKGKSLHAALKKVVQGNGHDSKRLDKFETPKNFEVAKELKAFLTEATKPF